MSGPARAAQLQRSWDVNADAWTRAVREGQIASRRLATDAAIVAAVRERAPRRVLDVGCGEGWLVRALATEGIEVVGVDASAPLVESARALGGGVFYTWSYAEIAAHPASLGDDYDAVVCNFSLLGEELDPLLRALHSRLAPGGALLIQTVHPWAACGEEPYRDGWRTESFDRFGAAFPAAMPWFFRTVASWMDVVRRAGFQVGDVRGPVHPESGAPLSLLLACAPAAGSR